ncbi:MAG: glutaredoxin [Verrucomicrobiota bacterium]|nr:glutaredoxin [Verrucomicrobiota bacterium]|tara:strand:+ start:580 stop:930 length:351 start_codon:yes stop_codon:yes gene_type:complete
MKIKAYLKPHCGWSMGVRAIMDKYDLKYDDLDIINNQDIYAEMVEKSGQPLSPCVEIDGVMLADVSGEEVENYMISNKLVQESTNQTSVPTNSPCSDEEHERQRTESQNSSPVRFF